jgi:hypothetical protein
MKLNILFFIAFLIQGCNSNNYRYLSPSELDGITLQPGEHVYKMKVRVEAKSKCKSFILLQIDSTFYTIQVNNNIDTSFLEDWYQNPMYIKVTTDSCLIKDPVIGVKFID